MNNSEGKIKRSIVTPKNPEDKIQVNPELNLFSAEEHTTPTIHKLPNRLTDQNSQQANPSFLINKTMPLPNNWNIKDGDFENGIEQDENKTVKYRENKKKLNKFIFGVALLFVAILVLILASIISKL